VSRNTGHYKPGDRAQGTSRTASIDLSLRVVVEVDPALCYCAGACDGKQGEGETLPVGCGDVGARGVRMVRVVSEQEEEGQVCREEGDELGVGGRHAVAFTMHLCKAPG